MSNATEDLTQGTQIGDGADDPTRSLTIGDPESNADPTQGRGRETDPCADPTQGHRIGFASNEDPTQGRTAGQLPGEDPTQPR